jgi:hypothetical protein
MSARSLSGAKFQDATLDRPSPVVTKRKIARTNVYDVQSHLI